METILPVRKKMISHDTMIEMRFNPEQLVDNFNADVYKLCIRLTFSKEDAEDLFQDTFIKAIEQIGKVNAAENPRAFLFSIAIFLWKSRKRKYARRQSQVQFVPLENDITDATDMIGDMVVREEESLVRRVVESLPDKFRIPVVLHYTGEMNITEIGNAMKIPTGTVKSRLHKARKLIQEELERQGYEQ